MHIASTGSTTQRISRTGLADGNTSDAAVIEFANGTGAVAELRSGGDGDLQINTRAISTDSYNNSLFIKGATGNVGIGTASPNDNYGTNLAVHDSGTTGARLKLSTSGTGEGNLDGFDVISTGSNAFILNRESGTLALGSNNTTAAEIASGGEFRFNSGYGSVATAYGVRAWVTFSNTGSIIADGNVTSVSKASPSNFTINFTSSFTDNKYCIVGMGDDNTNGGDECMVVTRDLNMTKSTTACTVKTVVNWGGATSRAVYGDTYVAFIR